MGPLLKTTWSQGAGFNNLVPLVCGTGRAPAGCVAIALAQVLYYHQYPKTYVWSSMDPQYGGNEASRLISNVGAYLGTKYECGGYSASTDDVVGVLKNKMGYSSANYANFNSNTVKDQIRRGQPVILRGGQKSGDGHAWVCDGYWVTNSCTYTTLALHMNWGWGKGYPREFNGWYNVGDWDSQNGIFDQNNKMVYNIKP